MPAATSNSGVFVGTGVSVDTGVIVGTGVDVGTGVSLDRGLGVTSGSGVRVGAGVNVGAPGSSVFEGVAVDSVVTQSTLPRMVTLYDLNSSLLGALRTTRQVVSMPY